MDENISEALYRRRRRDFEGPIHEIGIHEPIVHRILMRYAKGEIVTKEEALSQMVVDLARNLDRRTEMLIKAEMLKVAPRPIKVDSTYDILSKSPDNKETYDASYLGDGSGEKY